MLFRGSARRIKPGGVNPGLHSVRASQLPYQQWDFDSRYLGKTAEQVITKYKTDSFPKYRFPAELLGRKVEEINAMAKKMKLVAAQDAMQLLTSAQYHNDNLQIQ